MKIEKILNFVKWYHSADNDNSAYLCQIMINILYFAKLKEQLGVAEEPIEQSFATANELKAHLCQRGEKWQQALNNPETQIAINQNLSTWESPIPENAEIALFPPITGG